MTHARYERVLDVLAIARRNQRLAYDPRDNPIAATQIRAAFVDLECAVFKHRAMMQLRAEHNRVRMSPTVSSDLYT